MSLRNRIAAIVATILFFVLVGTSTAAALWSTTATVGASVKVANLSASCGSTAMQNASFEDPAIGGTLGYANDGEMPGWRAKNAAGNPVRIEIWRGYDNVPAGTGNQHVELNADVPGTIYQTLDTIPGQTLQWSLMHRGRSGTDTMRLLIGAENATGVSQGDFSDDNTAWKRYSGAYVVPAGQTRTTLAFVAVSAAGGDSVGNFLDDVSFGSGPCLTNNTTVANITNPGGTYRPGDEIEYTSVVTNSGSSLSLGTVYEAVLPTGLTYKPASITVNGTARTDALADDVANYVAADRKVVARLGTGSSATAGGTIAQNTQTVTVRYRATIPVASAGTTIDMTPAVTYMNGLATSWTLSATSNTATITVAQATDLQVVVTSNPTMVPRNNGGPVTATWSIVVTNNGPVASGPTTTVAITPPTGVGLTGNTVAVYTPVAGTTATCTAAACTVSPAIASGQSRTFTLSRTVSRTTNWWETITPLGTTYTLTAAVSSAVADINAANNSDSATVTVVEATAPTVPTTLRASETSRSQTTLVWNASTDNVGVTGYNIYRAGVLIGTSPTPTFTNVGLTPSTAYTYTVAAFDAAGNVSGQSNTVTVRTGAAFAAGQNYRIVQTNSGRCVNALGAATANGTAVTQTDCINGAENQRWRFEESEDGFYKVLPANSATAGWAIALGTNNGLNDGQQQQLQNHTQAANQQWTAFLTSGNIYTFVNRNSGKCLDLNGQSTTNNLQIQQYTCNSTVAQTFSMTAVN